MLANSTDRHNLSIAPYIYGGIFWGDQEDGLRHMVMLTSDIRWSFWCSFWGCSPSICSGVLLHNDQTKDAFVLSAKHCVEDGEDRFYHLCGESEPSDGCFYALYPSCNYKEVNKSNGVPEMYLFKPSEPSLSLNPITSKDQLEENGYADIVLIKLKDRITNKAICSGGSKKKISNLRPLQIRFLPKAPTYIILVTAEPDKCQMMDRAVN